MGVHHEDHDRDPPPLPAKKFCKRQVNRFDGIRRPLPRTSAIRDIQAPIRELALLLAMFTQPALLWPPTRQTAAVTSGQLQPARPTLPLGSAIESPLAPPSFVGGGSAPGVVVSVRGGLGRGFCHGPTPAPWGLGGRYTPPSVSAGFWLAGDVLVSLGCAPASTKI